MSEWEDEVFKTSELTPLAHQPILPSSELNKGGGSHFIIKDI
jgi:hypothetical protein